MNSYASTNMINTVGLLNNLSETKLRLVINITQQSLTKFSLSVGNFLIKLRVVISTITDNVQRGG